MELTLKKELIPGAFEISNFNELKEIITTISNKYATLVITEGDVAAAKRDRADLNAAAESFDKKRKEYQKEYLKPFNEGKEKIDELIKLFKDASANLDVQIKEFENKDAEKKLGSIKNEFNKIIEEQNLPFITFDGIYNEKWINKGMNEKKIKAEILDRLSGIKNDLYIIGLHYSNLDLKDEITLEYYRLINARETNCLTAAIKNVNDRHEMMKAMKDTQITEEHVNGVFTVKYVISGTKEQLTDISNYLKDHKYTYRVEKE